MIEKLWVLNGYAIAVFSQDTGFSQFFCLNPLQKIVRSKVYEALVMMMKRTQGGITCKKGKEYVIKLYE
jgi:hypothetical protein